MKKKAVFFIAMLFLAICLLSSCGKQPERKSAHATIQNTQEVQKKEISINGIVYDSSNAPLSKGEIELSYLNGDCFSKTIASGTFCIQNAYADQNISVSVLLKDGSKVESSMSIWRGFETAYYNNHNQMSVDIDAMAEELYLKMQLSEEGRIIVVYASEVGFEEKEEGAGDFDGVNLDEIDETLMLPKKVVTKNGVNLRKTPSLDGAVIRKLEYGMELYFSGEEEGEDGEKWYHVSIDENTSGYVSAEYLGDAKKVLKNGVNMRQIPAQDGGLVMVLSKGQKVIVLGEEQDEENNTWYHVAIESGHTGYVRADLIKG